MISCEGEEVYKGFLEYKNGKLFLVEHVNGFKFYEKGGWFGEEEEEVGYAEVWASFDGSPMKPTRLFYEVCGKHAEFYIKRSELQVEPVYKITVSWIREEWLKGRVVIDRFQVKDNVLEITRIWEGGTRVIRKPGELSFLAPAVKAAVDKSVCEECTHPHFILWDEKELPIDNLGALFPEKGGDMHNLRVKLDEVEVKERRDGK